MDDIIPENTGVVNTCNHVIRAKRADGTIVTFPSTDECIVRCKQVDAGKADPFEGVPVINAGGYELDPAAPFDKMKNAKVLLVSTIVAGFAGQIREQTTPGVRILVPDSGPSAVRDENGIIKCVTGFLAY